MTVLTYPGGKELDWDSVAHDPKRVTKLVMWDKRSRYGQIVKGSLFPIACLDAMSTKAVKRFGRPVTVIQPCFNTSVRASAGTHDWDYCMDWEISGVSGLDCQHFARFECGWADWFRTPAQGFPLHQHGFPLPPGGHDFPTRVGIYVDGANGLTSSQCDDYWHESYGLAGLHYQSADPTPFPTDAQKMAGIFNLDRYIQLKREKDMEYKDWSEQSQKQMVGDVAEAVAHRILDVETVLLKKDGKKDEKIPLRNAHQRTMNNTE